MAKLQRRELWMTVHRYLGLASMLFLGLAALTGCILAYAHPIDAALNADLFKRPVATTRVDPALAAERYQAANPGVQIVSLVLNPGEGRNLAIAVAAAPGGEAPALDQVFLDGVDGHVVGARSTAPGWGQRQIIAGLTLFHYTLLAGDWGRWLMGVMALAWLISIVVGVYLTLPRKGPFLTTWRRAWTFSFRSIFARLMIDIHRASGLWVLIGVAILAFTSVCLNFYGEAYEPTVVRISPLKRSLFDRPAPFPDGTTPRLNWQQGIAAAQAHARQVGQGWRPATALYNPKWNLYAVTFTNDGSLNYRALGPVYYYVDGNDGRYVHDVDPYSDSAGLVMIRMLYPLHSGQVGGPITVFIIFLMGLATVEMCGTGLYIWWKKRRSRVAAAVARKRLEARA